MSAGTQVPAHFLSPGPPLGVSTPVVCLNKAGEVSYGRTKSHQQIKPLPNMLMTLAIILIVLWLLGMISSYTLGGWLHILLVVAVIAILVRLIAGRPGPPPPV